MLKARAGLLLLSLALVLVPSALAQDPRPSPRRPVGLGSPRTIPEAFVLAGRVMAEDMKTVPRVLVRVYAQNGAPVGETFTDNRGWFEFRGLTRGQYTVEMSQEGFEPVQVTVSLLLGSRHDTVLFLKPLQELTEPAPPGAAVDVRTLQIPSDARKEFDQGMKEVQERKRPERSLEHFRKAIEIYPDYDAAYVELALAHLELSQPTEAEGALVKAVEVNEKNVPAHMILGNVYSHQGQLEKAAKSLQAALALDDNVWLAHLEVAKILLQQDKVEEAKIHALRAHELNLQVPSVHLVLANLALRDRDADAALTELDEFLELFPQHPMAEQVRQRSAALRAAQNAAPKN